MKRKIMSRRVVLQCSICIATGLMLNIAHNITVNAEIYTSSSASITSADWITEDIGTVSTSGTFSINNDQYSLKGSGIDIFGLQDSFRYGYKSVAGDYAIIAQIVSQQITSPWCKSGLMIRENNSAGSKNFYVGMTPAHGITYQVRTIQNGPTTNDLVPATSPKYLKLIRIGNKFSAYLSDDGVTWNKISTTKSIVMSDSVLIGFGATGGTSTFDNVQIYVPMVPTDLVANSITKTGFTLSWTAPKDDVIITGYDIYNGVDLVGSTTGLTYNVTGLTLNTSYNMTVKVKNDGHEYVASEPLSVTTAGDTQAPTTPTGLVSSSITSTSFTLGWTASTDDIGVEEYDIYENGTKIGTATGPSYAVTGLSPNTIHSMTVEAKDAAGNVSAVSAALPVTTLADTQAPTTPTGLVSSSITSTSFTLGWTASTDDIGVAEYDIYDNGTKIGTATGPSYAVTGLSPNTIHSMTVEAKDVAGNVSVASAALPVTTSMVSNPNDVQAPTAPMGLMASSITNTGFNLGWIASTDDVGVTEYDIYDNGTKIGTTTGPSYVVTGLNPNTIHSMTVEAKDAAGNVSVASAALSVTTSIVSSPNDTQELAAPTGLVASSITSTGFTLKWVAPTNGVEVAGYDIYDRTNLVKRTTGAAVSYKIKGLTPNTKHYMTVKARDGEGSSNEVIVRTLSSNSEKSHRHSASSNVTTIYVPWFQSEVKYKFHFGKEEYDEVTGNYCKKFVDIISQPSSLNLNFARTYNSIDDKVGMFGKGWTFSFEGRIQDYGPEINSKLVKRTDGSCEIFRTKDGIVYASENTRDTLVKQLDNTFILKTKDQHIYGYNIAGYLIWIKDKNGNTVNIDMDPLGKVIGVKDAVGRYFTISYNEQGLVDSITDIENKTVKYLYTNNNLTKVINPDRQSINYEYDNENMINVIKDNRLNTVELITYIHDRGENDKKIDKRVDIYGNSYSYTYDNANMKNRISNSNGSQKTLWYNSNYFVTNVRDSEGKNIDVNYNNNSMGEEIYIRDMNGNVTYNRDINGNIIRKINPDGSSKEMTYDTNNNIISELNEKGKYTIYNYDSNGNIITKKEYLGGMDQGTTSYAYYSKEESTRLFGCSLIGLLKSMYVVLPKETSLITYTYDAYGNMKPVTDK